MGPEGMGGSGSRMLPLVVVATLVSSWVENPTQQGGEGKENRALEEARRADRDGLNQNSEQQRPVADTGPRTVTLHLTQLRGAARVARA